MVAQPKPDKSNSYVELTPIRRKPINRGAYEWGKYVVNLRSNRLMTQQDVAKAMGTSVTTLTSIENGLHKRQLVTLRKLRTALGMDKQPREEFLPDKWWSDVVKGES